MEFADKRQKCHEYVEALEEEKRKIQVFKRELPLCLELVTQAIEACKRELSGTTVEYMQEQSECSEQTSSDDHHGPVLEEFMPIKRSTHHSTTCSHNDDDEDDDDQQEEHSAHEPKVDEMNGGDQKKKSDWLRSVQLWNPSSDPVKQDLPRKAVVTEVKMNGSTCGAFQPFNKDKSYGKSCSSNNADTNNQVTAKAAAASVPPTAASSTAEPVVNGGSNKEEKDGQRKQRRCWSPELHRRFLHALQQLGGSHVATPKQIRELMKVDGLTNDEVKSHLQKYRLHTRRPNHHHNNNNNNNNPQPPQFVVVGGIWVPPAEYTAVTGSGETATIATPNGIYAPVATTPAVTISRAQKPWQSHSDNLQSEGASSRCKEGGVHSNNSPATSSSTHNTSSSPAVF